MIRDTARKFGQGKGKPDSSHQGKGMAINALHPVVCGQHYGGHLSADALSSESNHPALGRFSKNNRITRTSDEDQARAAYIDEILARRRAAEERG